MLANIRLKIKKNSKTEESAGEKEPLQSGDQLMTVRAVVQCK